MTLPRITLDGIMALRPCGDYPRKRIVKLMGKRKSVNALDVLESKIPDDDKLWLVLCEELIPAQQLRELSCDFAQSALDRHGNGDERSQVAIDVLLGYAAGMVRDAAWAAAWAAVWDAAWDAARAAAWDAAKTEQVAHIRKVLGDSERIRRRVCPTGKPARKEEGK